MQYAGTCNSGSSAATGEWLSNDDYYYTLKRGGGTSNGNNRFDYDSTGLNLYTGGANYEVGDDSTACGIWTSAKDGTTYLDDLRFFQDKLLRSIALPPSEWFVTAPPWTAYSSNTESNVPDWNRPWSTPIDMRERSSLRVVEGPEERARALLRRIIGEQAFRDYLRNGFVTYRGQSGKFYQIFPGSKQVQVWDRGKPVERLCLVFERHDLPPTDYIVMRLLFLENDEAGFRSRSNVFGFSRGQRLPEQQVERGRILRMMQTKKAGNDGIIIYEDKKLMVTINPNPNEMPAIEVA